MNEKQLENMQSCGLRIICVLFMQTETGNCRYRVYTSDGGFTDYLGYNHVPEFVKDWLSIRNTFEYVVPRCMLVSGCKVV